MTLTLRSAGTGLKLEETVVQEGSPVLPYNISTARPRPIIPVACCHWVFDSVHSVSHPRVQTLMKLIRANQNTP